MRLRVDTKNYNISDAKRGHVSGLSGGPINEDPEQKDAIDHIFTSKIVSYQQTLVNSQDGSESMNTQEMHQSSQGISQNVSQVVHNKSSIHGQSYIGNSQIG